jgi:hypothetical protein
MREPNARPSPTPTNTTVRRDGAGYSSNMRTSDHSRIVMAAANGVSLALMYMWPS